METQTEKPVNLATLMERFSTPEAAREYLERLLWADGPVCPGCGVVNEATKLQGKSHRPGLYKCRACSHHFTVTVGTIWEDSHIPLNKWLIASHLLCANKKAISTMSISRMLGIGYKSAWHMMHRIRLSMAEANPSKLLGVVEADETFVGGKARNAHANKPVPVKTPVLVAVERNGKMRVRSKAITNVDEKSIGPILKAHVSKGAVLQTDSAPVYIKIGEHFTGGHEAVNHSVGEYVRGRSGTQIAESYNALVKRCVMGAWHRVSPEHLDRYLAEIDFRWNTRHLMDGARMNIALRQSEGRRLTYRTLAGVSR